MRALFLVAILVVGCGGTAATSVPQASTPSAAAATLAPSASAATASAPTSAAAASAPTAAAATSAPTAAPTATPAPTAAPTRAPTPAVTPAPPTPAVTVPPTPGARLPLKVLEFGLTTVSGPVWYGIIVENPNTDWAVFGTGVEITFLDAKGKKMASVAGLIGSLFPGRKAAIGGQSPSGARAASMKVELIEGEAIPLTGPPEVLTASKVKTTVTGDRMTTTGTVTNSSAQALDFVVVTVIYRNAAGKITGGSTDRVRVPANGKTTFEILAIEVLPHDKTEVYFSS